MKNKKTTYAIVGSLCFVFACVCATVYSVFPDKHIKVLAALGFTACFCVGFKTLMEFLKDIGFGKRFLGGIKKALSGIFKFTADKLGIGKDESKIYLSPGRDEFKWKFEFFKASPVKEEKKAKPKLARYSSLKSEKAKVRHIYTVFLRRKQERGYAVSPVRTPAELGTELAESEKARTLFSSYESARYADENEKITSETVTYLEELVK